MASVQPRIVLVAAPRSGAGLTQSAWLLDSRWSRSGLSGDDPLVDDVPDEPDEPHVPDQSGVESHAPSSHRIDADAVTEGAVARVRAAWEVDDRPAIDWAPRWSLRIPLLRAADPDVRFIHVVRDPRPAIASLVQAWRSGRFVSEPDLPGWWGEKWSFPLVPGWADVVGKPLHEVAAAQWLTIESTIRADLADVDASRQAVVTYESLVNDAESVLRAAAAALGVEWAAEIDELPLSRWTVSRPDATKWHREAVEVAAGLAARRDDHVAFLEFADAIDRPDYREPISVEAPKPLAQQVTRPSSGTAFASQHSSTFAQLLEQARASVVISTYKSGNVIFARARDGMVNTHVLRFDRPMGMAARGPRLAIGTGQAIETFWNQPSLASQVDPDGRHDAIYLPRSVTFTGDVAIHEMDYDADGTLWFVNTRFSCLARQDLVHSFEAAWTPPWITGLAAEDRCHLNGLAMVDGRPTYVTALARTDEPNGWRELKGTSGVIVDVASGEPVTEGLAMPHSPRWHDGRLWVLESGTGRLLTVELGSGRVTEVAVLPGFTRGLAFIGHFALVGLSQVRESVFSGLPITQRAAERNCGVWVLDTNTGAIVALLKFDGAVQEVFDVTVLPGATWPTMLQPGASTASAFVLSPNTLSQLAGR